MSSFSISFTLVISTMTIRSMMLHMRVMTNNMGAMLNLSVFLLTMSVCNILTLFNIGGVHNVFTLVMFLMFWYLVDTTYIEECEYVTLFNIGGVHNVFTLVMFLMFWYLVALVVLLVMATRTT